MIAHTERVRCRRGARDHWAALVVAAGMLACNVGGASDHLVLDGGIQIEAALHLDTLVLDPDGPAVLHPMDIRVRGDSVIVVDNESDRVVHLDTALTYVGAIGRTGRGPGELRDPFSLEVGDTWLAVAEITNGRISVFGYDGTLIRHVAVGALEFTVDSRGRFFVPSEDPRYFLEVVDSQGVRRPFGAVPDPGAASTTWPADGNRVLVAAADSLIHVFDNGRGILLRYALGGTVRGQSRLPRAYLRHLRSRIEATRSDFGGAPVSAGYAKDLSLTDDGRLLLSFTHPDVLGLLIDPESRRAVPVYLPGDDADRARLRATNSAILHGGRLYTTGRPGIGVYALSMENRGTAAQHR